MTALLTELLIVASIAVPGGFIIGRTIVWAAKREPRKP